MTTFSSMVRINRYLNLLIVQGLFEKAVDAIKETLGLDS